MPDQPGDRKHGPDDGDDVDDERTEDQAEDAVQNIGFDRLDLSLQAQLGLAQLTPQIGDLGFQFGAEFGNVRFGGEIPWSLPALLRRWLRPAAR
jgi:hypothetical protein